jgi:truncated hemoglobin YjbI
VGGFPALLRLTRRFYEKHVPEDKGITLEQRARWVALLDRSADDVGLR